MEKEYSFLAEYAKSDRSGCKGCGTNIKKDSLRLAILVQSAKFDGKMPMWYHVKCFFKKTTIKDISDVKNFDILRWDDQEVIKNGMESKADQKEPKKSSKSLKKAKKRSNDVEKNDNSDAKKFKKNDEESERNEQLKIQNKLIWEVRDQLQGQLNKNQMAEILRANKQYVPIGEIDSLIWLAECMVFGCINHCPDCGGYLRYSNGLYVCTSMKEWMKCMYETESVTTCPMIIPEEYKEFDCFKNYKYVERVRVLPKRLEIKNDNNNNKSGSNEVISNEITLSGYEIAIDNGKYDEGHTKSSLKERVHKLGGKVAKKLNQNCIVYITSSTAFKSKEIDQLKGNLAKAKTENIDLVGPEWLDCVEKGNVTVPLSVQQCCLQKDNWGRKIDEMTALREINEIKSSDSVKDVQKMLIKGGAVVDPDSGLEDEVHIYQEKRTNTKYTAVLGLVDITRGINSYYKLQLLEATNSAEWWVFRSWGRIGTKIGGNTKENFSNVNDAIENFKFYFLDKTGNLWDNRHKIEKKPGRFYPLDIDYGEEAQKNFETTEIESKLPEPIQILIKFIFDIESMKETVLEFEIDMAKMPLGKLSKKQIEQAYQALKDLQDMVTIRNNNTGLTAEEKARKNGKIIELTTKFYTLMPHNFGMKSPPLIDNLDLIKTKCKMLDNLLEIEIAYTLMHTSDAGSDTVSPIDHHYMQLKNTITPLDKSSSQWDRIQRYLSNTKGPTHRHYDLEINNIFELERFFEGKEHKRFRSLSNRYMLWHGSRRTNWAGILSQGLRIAPPEAPVTGYMFGKGIYFADAVSKSANYCFTNSQSPKGLLLLCEVALGNSTKRLKCDTDIKLLPGEDSCHGVGRHQPDPSKSETDSDGVTYPMGNLIKTSNFQGSLLYNEFIVYDVARVRQRYLLEVTFEY